jgi:hypothetical protein
VDFGGGGGRCADRGDQRGTEFGFIEAGDGAEGLREFLGYFIDPHRDGDHAARGLSDGGTDFGGGHAVWNRHVEVEDHDVGIVRLDQAKGFGVIGSFAEEFDVGRGFKDVADGAADGVKVVGDEDSYRHGTYLNSKAR